MGRKIPQALEYISQTSSKMRSLWAESSRGSDPNTNMSRTRKHNTKLVSANNRYDPEENELSLYSVQVTANVPSNTESVKSLVWAGNIGDSRSYASAEIGALCDWLAWGSAIITMLGGWTCLLTGWPLCLYCYSFYLSYILDFSKEAIDFNSLRLLNM